VESVRAAAPLALTAALVAGCGGGSNGDPTPTPTPTPVAALQSSANLRPPKVTINKHASNTSPGFVFLAPKAVFGAKKPPRAQYGPMIVDNRGRIRWFEPMPEKTTAADLRVQRYRGRPVLTYWRGRSVNGQGDGECVILDQRYREIATVGTEADFHDCQLTDDGTMLTLEYRNVERDLSAVGGKQKDSAVEGLVREIDVETGKELFRWSSFDHVGFDESYESIKKRYSGHWDYFHINSVDVDTDGHLLVSARHTWAVYKVHRKTGEVIWRLGGKRSDFDLGKGVRFSWQHDARSVGRDRVRIFDNAAASKKVLPHSRVITIKLDRRAKRATLVRSVEHPKGLSAGTQANAQTLPGGRMFVGWGSQGHFSEFDRKGKLLFDGRVPKGMDSYRAFRAPWKGMPSDKPRVAARGGAVYASFNGSTEVASWRVLAGRSRDALKRVKTARWNGLETRIATGAAGPYFAVEALDASGKLLARSDAVQMR
jgi:hypothetical protein